MKVYPLGPYTLRKRWWQINPRIAGASGKELQVSFAALRQLNRCMVAVEGWPEIQGKQVGLLNYLVVRATGATMYPHADMAKAFFSDPAEMTVAIFLRLEPWAQQQMENLE